MAADYTMPVYRLRGREYKTVNGFLNALLKDCGASASTMVRQDRTIECYNGPYGNRNTVAVYQVSKPELGKVMTVERMSDPVILPCKTCGTLLRNGAHPSTVSDAACLALFHKVAS